MNLGRFGPVRSTVALVVVLAGAGILAVQSLGVKGGDAASVVAVLFVVVKVLENWLADKNRQAADEALSTAADAESYDINPEITRKDLTDIFNVTPTPGVASVGSEGREPYVERALDIRLRAAILANDWVILVGRSKDGKSRAMYEAIVELYPGHKVVVPPSPTAENAKALRMIARPAYHLRASKSPTVLWLDDLEAFLTNGALDKTTLTRLLHRKTPTFRLVATMQNEQYEARTRAETQSSETGSVPRNTSGDADLVVRRAAPIFMDPDWTEAEVALAHQHYPDVAFDPALGLGAYLVGGPLLAAKLMNGRTLSGPGYGVALAAIDARRAGVSRPLRRDELKKIWKVCGSAVASSNSPDKLFDDGLTWACAPAPGGMSLVSENSGAYIAADYAVALRIGDRPGGPVEERVRPEFWDCLIAALPREDALQVASSARAAQAPIHAQKALERAKGARLPAIAAYASLALGDLQAHDLGQPTKAVAAYEEVEKLFGSATDPNLREIVAYALLNKGIALADTDPEGEVRTYDEVVARYADSGEPELKGTAARALFNKGLALNTRDLKGSAAAYDELINRFGLATEVVVREQIVKAMLNRAALIDSSDPAAKVAAYNEIDAQFGRAPEPELRGVVARALVNKAFVLSTRERSAGIAIYDEVIARFGNAPELDIRLEVARAMMLKAQDLQPEDRSGAVAVFEDVIQRFTRGPETASQRVVASALRNKAVALSAMGDYSAAIGSYEEIISRYRANQDREVLEQVPAAMLDEGRILAETDLPAAMKLWEAVDAQFANEPEIGFRKAVVLALWNRSDVLKASDPVAAASLWDAIVRRFGKEADLTFRERVAVSLLNKSAFVAKNDVPTAIQLCDKIIGDFGEASEVHLKVAVALALRNKGILLEPTDAIAAANAYRDVVRRFAEDEDSRLREVVAEARERLRIEWLDRTDFRKGLKAPIKAPEVLKLDGDTKD